jgi:UDP-glucose 4-epimerase
MKVLITGGAGYIGNELVYKLACDKNIDEIVIYDNLNKGNYNLFTGLRKMPHQNIKFIKGDILDGRKFRKALSGVDVVYHLAANVTTPFADQNPQFFEQINHWGTAEVCYAIESSDVSKLIYMSSVSVYGSQSGLVTIDTPLHPKTYYGISKKRGEDQVKRLSDKLDTFIVRSGNVFGYSKNMRIDAVINKFMFDAQFENRITINGDGNQHRSFINMELVVDVLKQLPFSGLESGIFNLVDRNLSIIDLATEVKGIYPTLEMIFVNQHLKMREIKVEKDQRLSRLTTLPEKSLKTELIEFKEKFTF